MALVYILFVKTSSMGRNGKWGMRNVSEKKLKCEKGTVWLSLANDRTDTRTHNR